MEIVIPVFTGIFCSLLLCAVIGVSWGSIYRKAVEIEPAAEIIPEEEEVNIFLTVKDDIQDTVLEYFRNPEYREWVIDFFSGVCSDTGIAQAILENADRFNVPPSLAFALSWEESRFNPNAINRHNRDGSIDRGLFQLNNRSFPNLETAVFFNVSVNAYYGVAHLRFCLDYGNSEVSALAMYNAGTGRVKTSGAPEVTLNYISRILDNRSKIESRFHARLIKEEEARLAEILLTEEEDTDPRFYFNRTLTTASPL